MTTLHEPGPEAPVHAARLGVLLAIADFPMLSSALRAVIDQEPDMHVVGEATGARPSWTGCAPRSPT